MAICGLVTDCDKIWEKLFLEVDRNILKCKSNTTLAKKLGKTF